ncbi:hypothetical protein HOO68_06870 [Candidatus Gracilibacteria bacterium]|nr:hypothetical protein [Candidatus Gracilibacteria bacterium]
MKKIIVILVLVSFIFIGVGLYFFGNKEVAPDNVSKKEIGTQKLYQKTESVGPSMPMITGATERIEAVGNILPPSLVIPEQKVESVGVNMPQI